MATQFNLPIIRGDTSPKMQVTYTDRGDLTGCTIRYTVKDEVDGKKRHELTLGSGITAVDLPNGRFDIQLSAAQTKALKPGEYAHDCEVTLGSIVDTVFEGTLTVTGDVSS